MKKLFTIFLSAFLGLFSLEAGVPVKTNLISTEDISVLSLNVGKLYKDATENKWEDRVQGIIGMMLEEEPLVAGFQTMLASQREELSTVLVKYSAIGAGALNGADKGPQNAIFYRNDLLELENSGTFWFSNTPSKPKTKFDCAEQICCATWAVFRLGGSGRRFIILNTSLDSKSEDARKLQAEMILEKLDEYGKGLPAVVMGDFNAGQAGTFGKDMKNPSVVLNSRLIDSRRMSFCSSSEKSQHYYGKKKAQMSDYIFYSPEFEGILFKTLTKPYEGVRFLSDHYPIRNYIRFRK